MTTWELADKIVYAVRMSEHRKEMAAVAVLRTLHANSSWFCRVSDPEDGLTVDTPYEQVQLELYR